MESNDNEYSKMTGPKFRKKFWARKTTFWKKALKRFIRYFCIFGMILEPIEGLKLVQVADFQKLFLDGKRSKVNFGPFWVRFCSKWA